MPADRTENRRKFMRAYGYNRPCEIRGSEQTYKASLVDISRGGMRLLLHQDIANPARLATGDCIEVEVVGLTQDKDLSRLTSVIRWHEGQQFGVQFLSPLRHGIAELQQLISFEPDQGLFIRRQK